MYHHCNVKKKSCITCVTAMLRNTLQKLKCIIFLNIKKYKENTQENKVSYYMHQYNIKKIKK